MIKIVRLCQYLGMELRMYLAKAGKGKLFSKFNYPVIPIWISNFIYFGVNLMILLVVFEWLLELADCLQDYVLIL